MLAQDGGLLQACINATSLALASAGIALGDLVCAVSGGVHGTFPLLDLSALEEGDLPNVTVAIMPRSGKVTLVTLETRLHVDRFGEVFARACEAGRVIHTEMRRAVRTRTSKLVDAMGAGTKGTGEEDVERDVLMSEINDF